MRFHHYVLPLCTALMVCVSVYNKVVLIQSHIEISDIMLIVLFYLLIYDICNSYTSVQKFGIGEGFFLHVF